MEREGPSGFIAGFNEPVGDVDRVADVVARYLDAKNVNRPTDADFEVLLRECSPGDRAVAEELLAFVDRLVEMRRTSWPPTVVWPSSEE